MSKSIIFDRDGTLIKHIPYLYKPELVELLPYVKDAIQLAIHKNIDLYIHTNQSGINRGYFKIEDVHSCNKRMLNLLEVDEHTFKEICICPERDDEQAIYRKPSTKFVQELIVKNNINKNDICYIGDRGIDIKTAVDSGVKGIGVNTSSYNIIEECKSLNITNYHLFDNLLEAVKYFINV